MSYVKMNGMWDDIKNSILPDSTTPTTTTNSTPGLSSEAWNNFTDTISDILGTGVKAVAHTANEVSSVVPADKSSNDDWLSKVLSFSTTLLKPNQTTASPLPTITIQQSPFPIVPVIAVGGVALVAVLLLTKKKK